MSKALGPVVEIDSGSGARNKERSALRSGIEPETFGKAGAQGGDTM
jgi:hypothetical protein